MTKEELEKEAREYLAEHSKYSEVFGEFFVAVDTLTAMLDFAEPREKRIKVLEKEVEQLRENNSYMFDTIALKSQQIEKLESTNKRISAECHKLVDSLEKLQKERECVRCLYTDSPCMREDYETDKNGMCSNFKNVFEAYNELKKEIDNAETKCIKGECPRLKTLNKQLQVLTDGVPWQDIKDKSEVIGNLTKAKKIIKGYMLFCKGETTHYKAIEKQAEQFLQENE